MSLRMVLPKVNPEAITVATRCAYAGCCGSKFYLRKARSETVARHGLSLSTCASLSVFEVQSDVPGLS
jgi:hypothetical protein